jgi:hypothetical protein
MSRLLRFAAVAAALLLVIGTGCKKNSAPEAPTVSGTGSARPGDTLTFRFSSTDPDGDSVFYMIAWRHGDSTPWSRARPSGDDYVLTQSYADTGTYYVKAKAKDGQDAESGWSDSIRVRIGSFPPEAPIRPTGPTQCSTGLAYTWATKASHPLRDNVSIQFSWGSGTADTSTWGPMVGNNDLYYEVHTYSRPGQYKISARARDAAGFESPWSETLVVTVDSSSFVPRSAPTHLALAAAGNDSTVRITWLPPTDTSYKPGSYRVRFRETGAPTYHTIGYDSLLSLSFVHDPVHRTGNYMVEAVYSNETIPSTETPSSAPHRSASLTVQEFSVAGQDGGYGWNRTTGEASLFDMTVADSANKIDLYFTDFAAGFTGPAFYVASPDTAPYDPGGTAPNVFWHTTKFIHLDSLADEQSILPSYFYSPYRRAGLLDSLPRFVASYATLDSFYALLYVTNVDTVNGTADIQSWFQKIKNLRLIEH